MRVLVDTNVLVRLASPGDPQRELAFAALAALVRAGHAPCLVPQCIYEYWVVATRPADQNGLGLTIEQAVVDLQRFDSDFELLSDSPELLAIWRTLVKDCQVIGKRAHDARLVAAMLRDGVTHLLTFNGADFARFEEISVLAPEDAASFPPVAPPTA